MNFNDVGMTAADLRNGRAYLFAHLDDLRRRIIYCLCFLLGGSVFGVWLVKPMIAWLVRPVGHLFFSRPAEAFLFHMKIVLSISFFLTLPIILYHASAFVASGLKEKEKHYLRAVVPAVYALFLLGASLSAFLIFPRAVEFLLTLQTPYFVPFLGAESYLDFFLLLCLAFGGLFQLPLVLHFLAKMRILTPELLTRNRRLTYLVLFIAATVFNPVPEVFTQLLLGFSAIILFEISVALVRWETGKQQSPG